MTLKNIFKNAGSANADKAFDRYHHGANQNQGYYGPHGGYNFHQAPPNYHNPHVYKHYSFSQHTSTGSKGGNGAAMSALTLLSFLFFLNILQQCLKDHMMAMNPQIAVMTAGREVPIVQDDAMNSKQAETDMYLIQQPKDKSYGIGRAYPLELSEGFDHFHSTQYSGNVSNKYDKNN